MPVTQNNVWSDFVDRKPPCWKQNLDYTCSRWSIKIAAKILGENLSPWKGWLLTCPKMGDDLDTAIRSFAKAFREISNRLRFKMLNVVGGEVKLTEITNKKAPSRRRTRSRRGGKHLRQFLHVDDIVHVLRPGTVVILQLQNMDWVGDRIVGGTKDHNICCFGRDKRYLYCDDSNKYKGKCIVKIDMRDLQTSIDDLEKDTEKGNLGKRRFYIGQAATCTVVKKISDYK